MHWFARQLLRPHGLGTRSLCAALYFGLLLWANETQPQPARQRLVFLLEGRPNAQDHAFEEEGIQDHFVKEVDVHEGKCDTPEPSTPVLSSIAEAQQFVNDQKANGENSSLVTCIDVSDQTTVEDALEIEKLLQSNGLKNIGWGPCFIAIVEGRVALGPEAVTPAEKQQKSVAVVWQMNSTNHYMDGGWGSTGFGGEALLRRDRIAETRTHEVAALRKASFELHLLVDRPGACGKSCWNAIFCFRFPGSAGRQMFAISGQTCVVPR